MEQQERMDQAEAKMQNLMDQTLGPLPSQQPAQLQFPCPKCPGIMLKVTYPPLVLNNDPVVSSLVIPHELHECPFCKTKFGLLVMQVQVAQWGLVPVQMGEALVQPASQMPKLKLT
jgi:hypothetical protein